MTRDEAIEALELIRIFDAPRLSEAVKIAIEALLAAPAGAAERRRNIMAYNVYISCDKCG